MRDTELLAEVTAKHNSMMSILGSRQASLQIVRSFWQRGDFRGALNAVLQSAGTGRTSALPCLACCHWSLPFTNAAAD